MPILNIYDQEKKAVHNARGGDGTIYGMTAWTEEDLNTPTVGVGLTIVPPGTSIGLHEHPAEEELYFVLKGEGLATVDGEENKVGPGDMILCPVGGSHAMKNTGDSDLEFFAMVVRQVK